MFMKYIAPRPVELNEAESVLFGRIPRVPSHEKWPEVADAMESLIVSLQDRQAVPLVRVRLFEDAAYAETGKRSPQQWFEANGVSGEEIFWHVDFIPYLRHFISGPNLPSEVIAGLIRILNENLGTSGTVMDEYRRFARSSIKTHRLSRTEAATEFFRLGVEIGMSVSAARTLRDAARSTR
jgi:hypothetical protein